MIKRISATKKEAFFNAIKKAILPKDDGNMEEEEVVPQKLLLKSKLVKKPCLYHSEPKTFIWLALRNRGETHVISIAD